MMVQLPKGVLENVEVHRKAAGKDQCWPVDQQKHLRADVL